MQQVEIAISKLMLIGVIVCLILVSVGSIYYLFQHGAQPVPHYIFPPTEAFELNTVKSILQAVNDFSSRGIIQLGLVTLLIVQILRVAFTAWFFVKLQDYIFVGISLFILVILCFTSLWRL